MDSVCLQGLTKGMNVRTSESHSEDRNRSEIILQASPSPTCFEPLCTPLIRSIPLPFPDKTQTYTRFGFIAILEKIPSSPTPKKL